MPPVVIENPILNSPFTEPARHFRFDEDGITSEVAEGRRRSTYFIPIPKPRVRGGDQLRLPGDWVGERMTDRGGCHSRTESGRVALTADSSTLDMAARGAQSWPVTV